MIMAVLAAHDGAVWTGANCGGLTRYDVTRFRPTTRPTVWPIVACGRSPRTRSAPSGLAPGAAGRSVFTTDSSRSTRRAGAWPATSSPVLSRRATVRTGRDARRRREPLEEWSVSHLYDRRRPCKQSDKQGVRGSSGTIWIGTSLGKPASDRGGPTSRTSPAHQRRMSALSDRIDTVPRFSDSFLKTTILRLDNGRIDAI